MCLGPGTNPGRSIPERQASATDDFPTFGLKTRWNGKMETLRWAALILNVLWVLQELLLFAAPGLWSGPIELVHLVIMFLMLLPFFSIFAILLPTHRIVARFAWVANIGSLLLLLLNLIRLNTADNHPGAFTITEIFLTFLAIIPLTLNSIYLFGLIMKGKAPPSRDAET